MTDDDLPRVRVHIVGIVVVALFGALLARLWVLQVATSPDEVTAIVMQNTTKEIQTESARGRIFDRNGRVLIDNQAEWALFVDPDIAQDSDAKAILIRRLARLLRDTASPLSATEITTRIEDPRQDPADDLLIAHGSDEISDEVRLQILEHQEEYPLVKIEMRTTRVYPDYLLYTDPLTGIEVPFAAHILGYTGNVTGRDELKNLKGYEDRDTIGRAGIEAAMESQLRGIPERQRVLLDPSRSRVGEPEVLKAGKAGNDVYLTLDLSLQVTAEVALEDAIRQDRALTWQPEDKEGNPLPIENFKAPGGAVVVLDAGNGDVLASASYPTYPTQQFIGGISTDEYQTLNDDPTKPTINRATATEYSTGSTFKPFTAIAAMRYGLLDPYRQILDDDGVVEIRPGVPPGTPEPLPGDEPPEGTVTFQNAGGAICGPTDLVLALTVSCDTYFYLIGNDFWKVWDNGTDSKGEKNVSVGYGLQRVARAFGFDEKTGIEVGELGGAVPDAKWKKATAEAIHEGDPVAINETDDWNIGDSILLAVGQGGFSATPLQLANAYAALANGGTLYQPRLVRRIDDVNMVVVSKPDPIVLNRIDVDPNDRQLVIDGLQKVITAQDGTASEAFRTSPAALIPGIAGKTGTAQKSGKADTSLFVAFVTLPAKNGAGTKTYVVAAVVEEAGFGARVAAPIVRSVIEQLAFGSVRTPLIVPEQKVKASER